MNLERGSLSPGAKIGEVALAPLPEVEIRTFDQVGNFQFEGQEVKESAGGHGKDFGVWGKLDEEVCSGLGEQVVFCLARGEAGRGKFRTEPGQGMRLEGDGDDGTFAGREIVALPHEAMMAKMDAVEISNSQDGTGLDLSKALEAKNKLHRRIFVAAGPRASGMGKIDHSGMRFVHECVEENVNCRGQASGHNMTYVG